MPSLKPLIDAWRLLRLAAAAPDRVPGWDIVVVTAASSAQAALYQHRLEAVRTAGLVAPATKLRVIADPEGARIGSGGATLHVLRTLASQPGGLPQRILIVHAGGDSRRLPWASVLGKAFIPVPLLAEPDGPAPTLFEHMLATVAAMPNMLPLGGVVCLSGDVLPVSPPADLRPVADGVTVMAAISPVTTALRHGVVIADSRGQVTHLLQKPSVEALEAAGGLRPGGQALIDTGIWCFAGSAFADLAGIAAAADNPVELLVSRGQECSLYEEIAARWLPSRQTWLRGRPLGDRLVADVRPPLCATICEQLVFLHFGTGTEVADHLGRDHQGLLARRVLSQDPGQVDPDAVVVESRCAIGAAVGAGSLVAGSSVGPHVYIGRRCVVVDVDVDLSAEHVELGDHRALWQVAVGNDAWVTAVVGVDDNTKDTWKNGRFLGGDAARWMRAHGVTAAELWASDAPQDGWSARLYPRLGVRSVSAALAWMLTDNPRSDHPGGVVWRQAARLSLADLARQVDPDRQAAAAQAHRLALLTDCLDRIAAGRRAGDVAAILRQLPVAARATAQRRAVQAVAAVTPAYRRHRLLGDLTGDDSAYARSWQSVTDAVEAAVPAAATAPWVARPAGAIGRSQLPVRVDIAGGWTDTPPVCLDHPAKVLNLAVCLDGQRPIGAEITALAEPALDIRLHGGRWHRLDAAAVLAPPRVDDPMVLPRLAVQVCGVVGEGIIRQGLRVDAWSHIPRGSGLGGSSILAAALVQALHRLAGRPDDPATISALVLRMEQALSTGGGWQDQLGALVPGAKLLTSLPVTPQRIDIQTIPQTAAQCAALYRRLILVSTGQERLARDVLQRVIGRYVSGDRVVTTGMRQLADLAEDGRTALARGDIDALGQIVADVWAIHQQLDPYCCNPQIDALFRPVAEHVHGWKLTGAGGGGHALLIARSDSDADAARAILRLRPDINILPWECAA
jgi:fucokinase